MEVLGIAGQFVWGINHVPLGDWQMSCHALSEAEKPRPFLQ